MSITSWYQLEQSFADLLNETNEPFRVGDFEYEYARTRELVDPTAYYQDLRAYADGLGIDMDTLKGECSVDC